MVLLPQTTVWLKSWHRVLQMSRSSAGVPTRCLITDMDQVLGYNVGNATEIQESIDFLIEPKKADERLLQLTLELAAQMLQLSGIEFDLVAARTKSQEALFSGQAAQVFGQMIHALGGPIDLLEKTDNYLVPMPIINPILSKSCGYITEMDVRCYWFKYDTSEGWTH